MAKISFSSTSDSGVSFTPNEYSLGTAIEGIKLHIDKIQREINLVDNSPRQWVLDSAGSTSEYASALNEFSRLSFTFSIGKDFMFLGNIFRFLERLVSICWHIRKVLW